MVFFSSFVVRKGIHGKLIQGDFYIVQIIQRLFADGVGFPLSGPELFFTVFCDALLAFGSMCHYGNQYD